MNFGGPGRVTGSSRQNRSRCLGSAEAVWRNDDADSASAGPGPLLHDVQRARLPDAVVRELLAVGGDARYGDPDTLEARRAQFP